MRLPSTAATQAIRGLAERQHGVVARRQLIQIGLGKGLIQNRVVGGNLIPLHRGVFAVGNARVGRFGTWMAAVLACGDGAALSHGSAADLWALRGSRGPAEVIRASGGRRRARIRLHQDRDLSPSDVTVQTAIPVTTIERTLVDMTGRLDVRQVERALVAADRSGRLRWSELTRLLDDGPPRRGIQQLRRAAALVDPGAVEVRSGVEVDFLGLCRERGLPRPSVNVLVEDYLVDFLWPDRHVVVETDSYRYHGDRPAFESDHQRTIDLTRAGYAVHRVTERMLAKNPGPFLDLVCQSLQAGAARP